MARPWVKLWCEGWLDGTMREELNPAERSVWADFLALAGESKEPGTISVAKGIPYSIDQLSQRLKVEKSCLNLAISKMIACKKITNSPEGIKIINWERYQSEYGRTKEYRALHTTIRESLIESYQEIYLVVTAVAIGVANATTFDMKIHLKEVRSKKLDIEKELLLLKEEIEKEKEENLLSKIWNLLPSPPFQNVRTIAVDSSRHKHIKKRLLNKDFVSNIPKVLRRIMTSKFCCGENDRGWIAHFDWFVANDENYNKVLEGKYKDRKKHEKERWIA